MPEAERRSPAQRRADGLIAMATAALDAGRASTDHGICPHVSVLMDAEVLPARSGGLR